MGVDALDIVAIILGVLFTIRKLDAQRRSTKEFPYVLPEDFTRWQQREVSAYGAAMLACFGKVLADWVFVYFFAAGMPDRLVRAVGATIDLSWIAVMLITFYRTVRLAKTRRELGIVLGGFIVEGKTELSTEIKSGLRDLEDGDLERAAYKFKQVSLDDDDSMKGIALYYLAECQWRMGELETARVTFRESIQADPSLVQPKEALERLEAELVGEKGS